MRSDWEMFQGSVRSPNRCQVNFYQPEARTGMHQDCDETDFKQPVISISLGAEALFRIGQKTRGGKTCHKNQCLDLKES